MYKNSFNQKQPIPHFLRNLEIHNRFYKILIVAMVEEISRLLDFDFPRVPPPLGPCGRPCIDPNNVVRSRRSAVIRARV